jgi:hypothetical protein
MAVAMRTCPPIRSTAFLKNGFDMTAEYQSTYYSVNQFFCFTQPLLASNFANMKKYGERVRARRITTADAEGRFKFSNIPAGEYYVRTQVTWEVGGYNQTQGGLVGHIIEVKDNQNKEVILNSFAQ